MRKGGYLVVSLDDESEAPSELEPEVLKSNEKSAQFVLYEHITKVSKQGSRVILPEVKQNIMTNIKEGNVKLADYIKLSRLQAVFDAFETQNHNILSTEIKNHLAAPMTKLSKDTKDFYFTFDKLTWKVQVKFTVFSLRGTMFKSVDFKLVNDGFVYTGAYAEQKNKYTKQKHDLSDWYEVKTTAHIAEIQGILDFITNNIVVVKNPLILYNYTHDRLDLQVKHRQNQISCSVTFEYGYPSYEFDDHWADD